jgi:RNA polymerase subunit RPABC4/transcription elongation factor Spt4
VLGPASRGGGLAAAWWTYTDKVRRSDSELARLTAAGWIVLSTPALLPFSLVVYAFARPQATVAQRRSRALVQALEPELENDLRCTECGSVVEDLWRRCPRCSSWLEAPCSACGRWSGLELPICPWCGGDLRAEPVVRTPVAIAAIATPDRDVRRSGRRAAGGRYVTSAELAQVGR